MGRLSMTERTYLPTYLGMLRYLQRDATACWLQKRLRTAHDRATTQTNKKRPRGSQCTAPPAKRRLNVTGNDRTWLKWSEAQRREAVNSLASTSYNALVLRLCACA